jgi:multidrug efflux pump
MTIPKEAEPDVRIPIIFVQLSQRGISPEDSERLLLRPVDTELKSVSNVKEMRSTAYEGGGYVLLEFEAGFDSKAALADVRAKVDTAKRDLPRDVDEPQVQEVNLSLYPVLVVGLSGDVPERTLLRIARSAKNALEQAPGVLSAELRGARDEAVEIIIDPMQMRSYGISLDTLGQVTQSFNTLIAAGALEGETGRFSVKVPSLFERPQDVLKVPLVASQNASVTLADIGQIKPTFKDPTSITRVNGRPAMTIEVSKRTGANLIEVVDTVKYIITQMQRTWPEAVHVTFTQDKSKVIRQMLGDLQNSVATGVLLVAVIILFALGFRASLFIGIAIPASFSRAPCSWPGSRSISWCCSRYPCRRHAGRRRHHCLGIRRAPHVGRHAAEAGLCGGRQPHVGAGDRGDRDPRRCLLAAAVLAGHRRRVHEIHADHADRHAVGVARGGAVLHAHAWRVARPRRAGGA